MILNQGLWQLVEDVHDDMTNGECGTSTEIFHKSHTGVITAIADTDIALADKGHSKTSIGVTYLLDGATANSNDITEFEVNNGATAYNRVRKTAVGKTANDEYTLIHTFDFQVV